MAADPRPAVFLDRDGTINAEVDYLSAPDQLELLPGAARAIARLNEAGFLVLVLTNQSGVARGLLGEDDLERIHARLAELLSAEGAHVDGIYACPHHPDHGEPPYRRACDCRKPDLGLARQALAEHAVDLTRSWVVGDSPRDLEALEPFEVPGLLVESGKPVSDESRGRWPVLEDLSAAVEGILAGR